MLGWACFWVRRNSTTCRICPQEDWPLLTPLLRRYPGGLWVLWLWRNMFSRVSGVALWKAWYNTPRLHYPISRILSLAIICKNDVPLFANFGNSFDPLHLLHESTGFLICPADPCRPYGEWWGALILGTQVKYTYLHRLKNCSIFCTYCMILRDFL